MSQRNKLNILLESGFSLYKAGKLKKAIKKFQKVLASGPNVEATNGSAIILRELKKFADAMMIIERGLIDAPKHPTLLNTRGTVLMAMGCTEDAIISYREAIRVEPQYADAWANLAFSLKKNEKTLHAIDALEQSIRCDPERFGLNYELGKLLLESGNAVSAEQKFKAVLKRSPLDPHVLNDLGNSLFAQGRFEEARMSFSQAIEQNNNFVAALNNLGSTLRRLADIDGSIKAYNAAIRFDPNHAEVRVNRALTLLLAGNFEAGFNEYDWRWQCKQSSPIPNPGCPRWQGEKVGKKTFLCVAEQGLGDTLQFARYLSILADSGGQIIFYCQPALVPLFKHLPYLKNVFPIGEPWVKADIFAPLLDCPKYLGIPSGLNVTNAYLPLSKANRLEFPGLKVGLVWAGNSDHVDDAQRSIKLSDFSPIFEVNEVSWFSLQVGDARLELKGHPKILDLGITFNDFFDTAKSISELDIVICVDTAVAHLAGGMGKSVWVLLADIPDWRWGLRSKQSLWYPTSRLFRKKKGGDWQPTMKKIANELVALSKFE